MSTTLYMQADNSEGGAFLVPGLHLKATRMQSLVRGKRECRVLCVVNENAELGAWQMSRQTGRQEAAICCIGLYGCLFAANFLCRICLLYFLFLPMYGMWKTSRQAESGNLLVCCIGLYDCMFIA